MRQAVTVIRLYEACKPDDPLMRNAKGRLVVGPKPAKKQTVQLRLKGFAFKVDGSLTWEDDPLILIHLGRWLEHWGGISFRARYQTSREHGFAIRFVRTDDAKDFLFQALQNQSVLRGNCWPVTGTAPQARTTFTQLPGPWDRALSRPFSQSLKARMFVLVDHPLQPDSYSVARLFDERIPDVEHASLQL